MRPTDEVLVERARGGDGAAIGELFSRYWRAARAAAFGVTGDVAAAEDAAADAFREAWACLDGLRDRGRFGPWLRTIVVRKARLVRRRDRVVDRDETSLEALPDAGDSPDGALQRAEQEALVHTLVRHLPPRLREAVSLFYFEGYETDQAATFLDIPPGTFRRRLHEARQHLRAAMDDMVHLKGLHPMTGQREQAMTKLRTLMDAAEQGDSTSLYHLFRGAFALRPVPTELVAAFAARHQGSWQRLETAAVQLANPSPRVSDPNHPVGIVADRLRRALPHEMSVRATRALVLPADDGSVHTTYELLRDSADPEAFRSGVSGARLSDVVDVTWRGAGPLDLRAVQDLLECVSAQVLPAISIRFFPYDEPRYRAALRGRLGSDERPAVIGGVLTEAAGQEAGRDTAHVRIFLEPWAALDSGQSIDFERSPDGWPST
jgi:RNA polymerase sigma-70 factor, ECF subfamily